MAPNKKKEVKQSMPLEDFEHVTVVNGVAQGYASWCPTCAKIISKPQLFKVCAHCGKQIAKGADLYKAYNLDAPLCQACVDEITALVNTFYNEL